MKSIGLQVPLKNAEEIRKYLISKKLIKQDLKICRDKSFVYFPIKEKIKLELDNFKIISKEFEKVHNKPKSYKDVVKIPSSFKKELPTSYDTIGSIILIKLPIQLNKYKREIGEALLKSNKNIKTVCNTKPVKGEYRTRDVKIIAGEKQTKTTHREYNLEFSLDVEKTYFSVRLASERRRVAELVRNDETIVDMFTGVAPFSIMIAKYASPKIIYAIDKNKYAIEYAKKNIAKNKVVDKVELICDDAKNIQNILNKKKVKADRIIMNLPFSAFKFFPYALKIISNKSIIHYYDILVEKKIKDRIKELKKIAKENEVVLTDFIVNRIKTYAPHEFYIGIDITAKRMPL